MPNQPPNPDEAVYFLTVAILSIIRAPESPPNPADVRSAVDAITCHVVDVLQHRSHLDSPTPAR